MARTIWRTLAVAFLVGSASVIFGQTNAVSAQPHTKRIGIGLGDSPLEDLPLPTAGAEPVGGVESAPSAKDDQAPDQVEPRKGEFIFAPIPVSSQAIGIGVVGIAAYVFPSTPGSSSHPSTLALAGTYTSTKTYGLGLGGNLILDKDRYRLTFLVGAARARYQFFGIGSDSGRSGQSFWLSQHGHAVLLQGMKRLKWDIFVGPRFSHRQIKAGEKNSLGDLSPSLPQFLPIQPQLNLALTSAGFGMRAERDKRDDMFYPHSGSRIDGRADFFGPYVGSTFTFQSYQFEANKYLAFGNRQVLALRGMGCGVTGDRVPFFELCQFGMMGDLRGYQLGRYRDRTMFATQAEWRVILWRRLGATVFGGVGEVAPRWSGYNVNNLLPAEGAGLRYNLSKQRRINLRLDLAYSKTGGSWSMGVGEVF